MGIDADSLTRSNELHRFRLSSGRHLGWQQLYRVVTELLPSFSTEFLPASAARPIDGRRLARRNSTPIPWNADGFDQVLSRFFPIGLLDGNSSCCDLRLLNRATAIMLFFFFAQIEEEEDGRGGGGGGGGGKMDQ